MKGFMITFNFLRFIFVFENYVCVCFNVHVGAVSREARRGRWIPGSWR